MLARAMTAVFAFLSILFAVPPVAFSGGIVTFKQPSAHQVRAYWTSEKLRNAVPMDLPNLKNPVEVERPASHLKQDPPTFVPPSAPGQNVDTSLRFRKIQMPRSIHAKPLPPQMPYSRFEITNPSAFPFSTNGKLFFKAYGQTGTCSATAITSSTKSLIFTAGHCLAPGNGQPPYSNFMYIPAYRMIGGPYLAPFGSFTASRFAVSSNWTKYGNRDYDVGAILLRSNAKGQLLQNVTGSRGIAFNQPRIQSFQIFGYPARAPFDGGKLWECDSTSVDGYFGITIGAGCDMNQGASGGGWIIRKSILNSVNGYKMVTPPQTGMVYGAYFGSSVASLYNLYR